MRLVFRTDNSGRQDGFRQWRAAINEMFGAVSISSIGSECFTGTLEEAKIGPLIVTKISQSAARYDMTPELIRKMGDIDYVSVSIMVEGSILIRQHGHDFVHSKGEIVLHDSLSSTVIGGNSTRTINMRIPRKLLEPMISRCRLYKSLKLDFNQTSTSIIYNYFQELLRVHSMLTSVTAERMALIGIDLIVAGFAERLAIEPPRSHSGSLIVQRAKAYVESTLCDTTLDPHHVAAAIGVSLRRLQELFHEHSLSISGWIWQRRLEVAAQRLANPACIHLSIQNLSYTCGFATQSHFTRRFKDFYGITPKDYRIFKIKQFNST